MPLRYVPATATRRSANPLHRETSAARSVGSQPRVSPSISRYAVLQYAREASPTIFELAFLAGQQWPRQKLRLFAFTMRRYDAPRFHAVGDICAVILAYQGQHHVETCSRLRCGDDASFIDVKRVGLDQNIGIILLELIGLCPVCCQGLSAQQPGCGKYEDPCAKCGDARATIMCGTNFFEQCVWRYFKRITLAGNNDRVPRSLAFSECRTVSVSPPAARMWSRSAAQVTKP